MQISLPLPTVLSSALSASQPWPVTVTRPPLQYQTLESLVDFRREESNTVLPASPLDLIQDLESEGIDVTSREDDQMAFLRVAVGLLYLSRLGYADECHALVLPLSWHEPFGVNFGPPLPGSLAEPLATMAHALVHRYEGSHVGELNMVGYNNAHFWAKATLQRDKDAAVPVPWQTIREAVENLLEVSENTASLDSLLLVEKLSPEALAVGREWFQEWIVEDMPDGGWDPRALTELCKSLEGQSPKDPLAEFGSKANQVECDVLIYFCLEQAGFAVDCIEKENKQNEVTCTTSDGDGENDALMLRAANKVSSAHLHFFQQNGSIVIRQVLTSDPNNEAIAVACRLLESPACATASSGDQNSEAIHVYYPDSKNNNSGDPILGYDLNPGDVLVAMTAVAASSQLNWMARLVSCQPNDDRAIYCDRLFGTRGETPTTVIQWSKGAIF